MLKKKALWKFRKILKKHFQNAFSKLENNNSFSYKTHQLKFQSVWLAFSFSIFPLKKCIKQTAKLEIELSTETLNQN